MAGVRPRRIVAALATALILFLVATVVLAQRESGGGIFLRGAAVMPNPKYDGRFTFVRLRYGAPTAYVSQALPWSHDYPRGEQHFMKILDELSYLNPHTEETSIYGLDDPDLFKYPIAYLCEPGAWDMTEQEAATFRAYMQKGGFLIVDDFRFFHWPNFELQMRRVLPQAQFVDLDATHPIFHTFSRLMGLTTSRTITTSNTTTMAAGRCFAAFLRIMIPTSG